MTEDRQEYEHGKELTEDGQKYEHNKMFEERCGINRETITVVSLLLIDLVIHCHCLTLRTCVFSTLINKGQDNKYRAPSKEDHVTYYSPPTSIIGDYKKRKRQTQSSIKQRLQYE